MALYVLDQPGVFPVVHKADDVGQGIHVPPRIIGQFQLRAHGMEKIGVPLAAEVAAAVLGDAAVVLQVFGNRERTRFFLVHFVIGPPEEGTAVFNRIPVIGCPPM